MSEDARPPLVLVAGPTASGKSALALDLAEAFNGTVINADSMQVYADLAVITARPTAADMARVPHRLYGVIDAADRCSVGRWLGLAVAAVREAWAAGRLPIAVGGTGLYLKALAEGLSPVPEIPEPVRRAARERYDRLGGDAFLAELRERDPETAGRLPPGDRSRLVRAREVLEATGKSLAQWQADHPPTPPLDARSATIALRPPREALYTAIDARFRAMVDGGGLDEVRALDARARAEGLDPELPALKAVGVPELRAALADTAATKTAGTAATKTADAATLDDAVADAQRATRNYAKRQLTWLRHQVSADFVIEAQYSETWRAEIINFVRRFLLIPPS